MREDEREESLRTSVRSAKAIISSALHRVESSPGYQNQQDMVLNLTHTLEIAVPFSGTLVECYVQRAVPCHVSIYSLLEIVCSLSGTEGQGS